MDNAYTLALPDGLTIRLVVVPKGDRFAVSSVDANGWHLRYMFGRKFDSIEAAHAAAAEYCAA